jgi:hypothetical protein
MQSYRIPPGASHDLFRWIIAMASECVNPHATSLQTAGHRTGTVEFWHGAGPELWPDQCGVDARPPARLPREHHAPAVARVGATMRSTKRAATGGSNAKRWM